MEKTSGGGGGGGRLAIYTSVINSFAGDIEAFGGRSDAEAGGAGTIYLSQSNNTISETTLIVKNDNLQPTIDFLPGKKKY